jgi:hypothetical protein
MWVESFSERCCFRRGTKTPLMWSLFILKTLSTLVVRRLGFNHVIVCQPPARGSENRTAAGIP